MYDGCISGDRLILYISKKLTERQVEEVENHLNQCTICRQHLLEATEKSENEEQFDAPPGWLVSKVAKMPETGVKVPRLYRFSKMGVAAVVAVVALTLGISFFLFDRNPRSSNGFRNGVTVSAQAPELSIPVIRANEIEFRWSPSPGVESYQLTILNETGDIVFQKAVQKRSFVLSTNEISFESEKPYFWFVTAKDSRAVTIDSRIQKLYPSKKSP